MIDIEENNNNNVSGVLKSFLSPILKVLLVATIIIVLVAGAVEIIKIKDGSYSNGNNSNTGYVVEQKALSNANIENIASTPDGWSLDIDLNTTVDEIITELENNNVFVIH